ncbi:MAG: AhpC/TSA family protein [Bacteroidales bacterium]|nr:AhpC/TSA family protein [Bacteroidales bacterium]
MKRLTQLALALILTSALWSCHEGKKFDVEGILEGEGIEGQTIYLIDTKHPDTIVDSTIITDGAFRFSGRVEEPYLAVAACGQNMVQFIIEPGHISVEGDSIGGTPLNDRLQSYIPRFNLSSLEQQMQELSMSYYTATDEAERAKIEQQLDVLMNVGNEHIMNICREMFDENKDNLLGLMALETMLQTDGLNYAELDSLIGAASYPMAESPVVKQKLEMLEHIEQTAVGKHYTDIEGVDGRLSDLIEGKVAVVDFYASWCRPCRNEITSYLVPLWKRYADKGVVVVGLNVWERGNREAREEAHRKAMEELGIDYPQLVDSTMVATDTYGVQGIPQILLIGRDGTILARNLRGEGIEAAVKEALK